VLLPTTLSRLLTHVVVLMAAAAVPLAGSLATLNNHPRYSPTPLRVEAGAPYASADEYVLNQRGVFLKPAAPVEEITARRDPARYRVQSGDTISQIAANFKLTIDSVRWANNLADIDTLKIGQELWIPPVNGVLVAVAAGDTLAGLASKFKGDTQAIIDFNLLRDPDHLAAGIPVMIPDGQGAPLPAPASAAAAANASASSSRTSAQPVPHTGPGANRFPWGYCTWWVASKRYVPWNGNAWEWWANARAFGFAEGRTPRPGAIMVTWESSVGHVAYVESVRPDGSFTVSEMNYHFILGEINYRTITPSQLGRLGLLGFIY
jgi:surface antigen